MIRNQVARAVSLVALSVVLVGCSSGPSESDVRKAVEKSIDTMNQQMAEFAGPAAAARLDRYRLTHFDLLGCEGADESYTCDAVMSMETPLVPVTDTPVTLRLRKGSGGWMVMEGLQ